jgi:GR25 family glycosyltransferase involved in LPS biosynthesis
MAHFMYVDFWCNFIKEHVSDICWDDAENTILILEDDEYLENNFMHAFFNINSSIQTKFILVKKNITDSDTTDDQVIDQLKHMSSGKNIIFNMFENCHEIGYNFDHKFVVFFDILVNTLSIDSNNEQCIKIITDTLQIIRDYKPHNNGFSIDMLELDESLGDNNQHVRIMESFHLICAGFPITDHIKESFLNYCNELLPHINVLRTKFRIDNHTIKRSLVSDTILGIQNPEHIMC